MKNITKNYKEALAGYLFLLPYCGFMVLFLIYPIVSTFKLSFYRWSLFNPPTFLGLDNYRSLLSDSVFWRSIINTTYFTAVTTPVLIVSALFLASLLIKPFKGQSSLRAIFFFPYLLPVSVISVLWAWLFQKYAGLINYYLTRLGFANPPPWLGDATWAMPAIIIASLWWAFGFDLLICIAALQQVSPTLYEAAKMDGAGRWACFIYITLPAIKRMVMFLCIIQIIAAYKTFGQVYIMTQGGPGGCTRVVVQYMYENAFKFFKMGYASSIACAFFAFTFLLSIAQIRLFKEK